MSTVVSRFVKAIEAKEISYREIAESIHAQVAFIYDLSAHEEDWFAVASIQDIVGISTLLGVSPAWVVAGDAE